MKFVCLCYEEEKQLESFSEGEWSEIVREVYATNAELREQGHLITSSALQPVKTAKSVRVRQGKVSITDGPFAETKEQLGGFFLIEAKDIDEATGIASRLVGARIGCIEVRATRDLADC